MKIRFWRRVVSLAIGLAIVAGTSSAQAQDQFNVNTNPAANAGTCEQIADVAWEKIQEERGQILAERQKGIIDCCSPKPSCTNEDMPCIEAVEKKTQAELDATKKEDIDRMNQLNNCHARRALAQKLGRGYTSLTDPNLNPGLHGKRFSKEPASQASSGSNGNPPSNSPPTSPYAPSPPNGGATSGNGGESWAPATSANGGATSGAGSGYWAPKTLPATGGPPAGPSPRLFKLRVEEVRKIDGAPTLDGGVDWGQPPKPGPPRAPSLGASGPVNGWKVFVDVTGASKGQYYKVNTPRTDKGNSPYQQVYGYYAGNTFTVTAVKDSNGWGGLPRPVTLPVRQSN